nr:immunoglobulin heavy chain junction region [Mus musculus]MBK4184066.1 immunoglobulin heavy chain junction region [Mus musculus]
CARDGYYPYYTMDYW